MQSNISDLPTFFQYWSPLLHQSLIASAESFVPEFHDNEIVAAAIVMAQAHTFPELRVLTNEQLNAWDPEERESKEWEPRLWPALDKASQEPLLELSDSMNSWIEDNQHVVKKQEDDGTWTWRHEWWVGSTDALVHTFSAQQVQDVFRVNGHEPVLFISCKDEHPEHMLEKLERLNLGRHDDTYKRAREYWTKKCD